MGPNDREGEGMDSMNFSASDDRVESSSDSDTGGFDTDMGDGYSSD